MLVRTIAIVAALGAAGVAVAASLRNDTPDPAQGAVITVYKTPTCGCCAQWVEHLRGAGFQVRAVDLEDLTEIKQGSGVPIRYRTCHTAVVNGYVVEGHVPADLVKRMLAEKPKAAGLAVPGMPMGSPGMEGATKDAYEVLLFQKDGTATVYARR